MSNVLNTVRSLLASHRKPAATAPRKPASEGWLVVVIPEVLDHEGSVVDAFKAIPLGCAATAGDAEQLAMSAIQAPHLAACGDSLRLSVSWRDKPLAVATAHADLQTFDEMDAGKPLVWRWRVEWPLDTCVAATR